MYPSKICYLTILPFCCGFLVYVSFLGGSVIKNPPAMQELQETCVRSLGWEDPLGEGMTTHSSILA